MKNKSLYAKSRRAKYIHLGICSNHITHPLLPGKKTCALCHIERAKRYKNEKKTIYKLKSQRICFIHKKKFIKGTSWCQLCKENKYKKYYGRKNNNICVNCGKNPINFKVCKTKCTFCYEEYKKKWGNVWTIYKKYRELEGWSEK